MLKAILKICIFISLLSSCKKEIPLIELNDLPKTLEKVNPGDTIYIKSGTYKDVQLKLEGYGTNNEPIIIMPEKHGKVFIEGESNINICGEYIEINGLYFLNGYTPKGNAIIEFRNGNKVAKNCRVTECVIDHFNPTNKNESGSWILLYGKNNRFDHNSILGKLYPGVTLAVILNEETDRNNCHRIDHNYFGERFILGSNGGETIRIGTSHHALFSSNTIVEDNMFYHCNGEVEVVSIKSSDNIIRNNVFLECRGILALRHGNRNIVKDNAFIGNNLPFTGGIRIVNEGHKIINNLFYRLKGERFFAALGIMNAVPNSLPNRYHQVKDVLLENNTFIDCENILLCVGKDNERTLPPDNIFFNNNKFINKTNLFLYKAYDNISGFKFSNNIINYPFNINKEGFKNDKTLLDTVDIKQFINKRTGASWYTPNKENIKFSGNVIKVKSGQNTLLHALERASNGDILTLTDDNTYWLDNSLNIDKYVRIQADSNLSKRPILRYNGKHNSCPFVTITNGGNLEILGVAFNGENEEGKGIIGDGINIKPGTITPYLLTINNCEFYNFNESNLAAIRGGKSTFSPKVVIKNSFFHDMSGEAINFAEEKDDKGKYNVENLYVENCVFYRLLGSALNIYRGGNDESTSGPSVIVNHCSLENVDNKEQGSAIRLIGVQNAIITNCSISNSGKGGASIRFNEMSWDKLLVSCINLFNSGRIFSFWNKLDNKSITNYKPEYVDLENGVFYQTIKSPLKNRALDNEDIGIVESF